jgi:hypothetical protein
MLKDLPVYLLVNDRPVKVIETEDGGLDVLVLNLQTGEFQRNLDYLDAYLEGGRDVEVLTEQEFSVTLEQTRGIHPS